MILKEVIYDEPTNSIEVTWVDEEGTNVKCRSYAGEQMAELEADFDADAVTVYADLLASVTGKVPPYVPPPIEVPFSITPLQAIWALDQFGLLDVIEAFMARPDTPRMTRAAWNRATEFTRDSPLLNSLALMLGLSATQLDALFVAAGGYKT